MFSGTAKMPLFETNQMPRPARPAAPVEKLTALGVTSESAHLMPGLGKRSRIEGYGAHSLAVGLSHFAADF